MSSKRKQQLDDAIKKIKNSKNLFDNEDESKNKERKNTMSPERTISDSEEKER